MDDASFENPDVMTAAAQGRLRTIIERIERLEEDKKAVMEDMKEVFAEAKGEGYDVKVLRKVILSSVSERVKEHGRAFGDPELGGPGQALSAMQGRKLKEIARKANGEDRSAPQRKRGARTPYPSRDINDE